MKSHTPRPLPQAAPTTKPPALRAATATGGQALDRHTQTRMNARFGHDFSQVRIHTDDQASQSAEAAGANAFAHGTDIVFGEGQWTPGSPQTERLLAHELTHVVQESLHGPGDPNRASDHADASEREASRLAADVAGGRDVTVEAHPGAAIARDSPFDKILPPLGDWRFSPTWKGSTDSSHDQQPGQGQANDRARQQEDDQRAAQRAGETDPRNKWWSPKPPDLTPPAGLPGSSATPTPGPYSPTPPAPLPKMPDYTPPSTYPNLGPPPPGPGPQLTPPTFPNVPGLYKPPPISLGIPPLQVPPITPPAKTAPPPSTPPVPTPKSPPAPPTPAQPAVPPAAPAAAPAPTAPGTTPAQPAVQPGPPAVAQAPTPAPEDNGTA